MKRLSDLREYARRLTRALRKIWEELERRVEQLIQEGCPYPPIKIADGVTIAIINWEFREAAT